MTNGTGLQLRSLLKKNGELELSLAEVPVPEPKDDDVLVRVEATPINPSDLGLLLASADVGTAQAGGTPDRPVVTLRVSEGVLRGMGARLDQSLPVGNEGAGTVIKAGKSPAAQALVGKRVAILGGAMYAEYRALPASAVLVLPDDATSRDGASCFVNPLTALSMTEVMRREGHKALVHTAAASNLGQMLNRICLADGIPLVNIVRKPEQAAILREIGAKYVIDSSAPTFFDDLVAALVETDATLAFDAIGGGRLASYILGGMEVAANKKPGAYSRYGSSVHKQVYIYGGLDRAPTELIRSFGMAWGLGGWLLTPFLEKIGPEANGRLRARVAAELKTTFASHYSDVISLRDALKLDVLQGYARMGTGAKYLIDPSRS
ncbi:MAG: zinc-binding dehydrogenase [Polyangiales bacterium]